MLANQIGFGVHHLASGVIEREAGGIGEVELVVGHRIGVVSRCLRSWFSL